jgi:hypothetical protein
VEWEPRARKSSLDFGLCYPPRAATRTGIWTRADTGGARLGRASVEWEARARKSSLDFGLCYPPRAATRTGIWTRADPGGARLGASKVYGVKTYYTLHCSVLAMPLTAKPNSRAAQPHQPTRWGQKPMASLAIDGPYKTAAERLVSARRGLSLVRCRTRWIGGESATVRVRLVGVQDALVSACPSVTVRRTNEV